ncbi:MAG: hypothetical protein QW454_00470 [Candidatus Bathyarchaeia archaeon]
MDSDPRHYSLEEFFPEVGYCKNAGFCAYSFVSSQYYDTFIFIPKD